MRFARLLVLFVLPFIACDSETPRFRDGEIVNLESIKQLPELLAACHETSPQLEATVALYVLGEEGPEGVPIELQVNAEIHPDHLACLKKQLQNAEH